MSLEIGQLRDIPLLEGLSEERLAQVAENASTRIYDDGTVVVHQADAGQTLYVITRGTVKVVNKQPDGGEVFLALLAAGDTFGEVGLVDQGRRSATVVALEETTVIAIDHGLCEDLLTSAPVFGRNLLQILARRLRLANIRIHAHCTLDVHERIARQLLEFAELYGQPQSDGSIVIPMRLTQSTMGEIVGASRERVNQVMSYYRQKGFIDLAPSYRVAVLQPDDLRHRAE